MYNFLMDKYDQLFIATTDTVVGIGAPISETNYKLLQKIKKRKRSKRLVIMIYSLEQAREFKDWSHNADLLAAKYWPGPVTLVLSSKVALRIPRNNHLIELIKKIGPIYMTSANLSGKKTLNFEEAIKQFPKIKKHYNFGEGQGSASMIIRVKDGKILRK